MSDDEETLTIDKKWADNGEEQDVKDDIQTQGDYIVLEDGLLFDPYNPVNIDITESEICSILSRYGVPDKVHNLDIYKRAFIHRSYIRRPEYALIENNIKIMDKREADKKYGTVMRLRTKSNERLEFLGDGVLECVTKYYLYRRFPKANEGFMTEKKIAIVKNENIGRLAMEMGLHKYFVISRYSESLGIRNNVKKLGCLFEAFIGALFLDFNKVDIKDEAGWFKNVFMVGPGIHMAQVFIENVFEKHINWVKLVDENDNYKNILQVRIQKVFKTTPFYVEWGVTEEEGYTIGVYVGHNIKHSGEIMKENIIQIEGDILFGNILKQMESNTNKCAFELGRCTHKVKKKAEQNACAMILERIKD